MDKTGFKVDERNSDSGLSDLETAEYTIAGVPLKEVQNAMLKILSRFITICEKYGLRYYLAGGTLLGAVRHSGFIPWDDDVDVIMPRKDYERFLELAEKEDPRFELVTFKNDPKYKALYAKYIDSETTVIGQETPGTRLGLWIDIFPLDNAPVSFCQKIKFYFGKRIYDSYDERSNHNLLSRWKKHPVVFPLKRITAFLLFRNWTLKEVLTKKESLFKSLCMQKTGYVCNYSKRQIVMPQSVFGEGKTAKFESLTAVVPDRYEVWLQKLYGPDYMQVPALEVPKKFHSSEMEFIDLRKPYREYLGEKK